MIESFHFLHPLWFFALIPLGLIVWLGFRSENNSWENVIDENLLPLLLQGEDSQAGKLTKWLLGLGALISVLALADPVWEKVPRPIFQTNTARIIVLDLSRSMMIKDLKPTRLARARFKIEDILSSEFLKKEEGQTGLVVFAGDAFTASPLTRDVDTIKSLLKVLTPRLLPAQGSRVDLGLKKAHELLTQAGTKNGSVLLIADGVTDKASAIREVKALKAASHRVSVLGVGTLAGGILPSLRTQQGLNITVKLEAEALQDIAKKGGGSYHEITNNNADLNSVLAKRKKGTQSQTNPDDDSFSSKSDLNTEDWKSIGPFLVLFLLPIAALAFRKGWLLNLFFVVSVVGLLSNPQQAMAFSLTEQWDKLWQNKEQRADNAFQQEQFDKASELAKSPLRRGSAEYKKGNYKKSLESFKQAKGADARFDEGNALAKLKKYQEALKAYDEALKEQPDMKDAQINKDSIKRYLKKKKEEKSGKDPKDSDKKKEGEENEDSKKNKDKEGDKGDKKSDKEKSGGDKNKKGDKKQGDKSGEPDKDKNQFSDANKKLKDKKEDSEKSKSEKEDNEESKKGDKDKDDKDKESKKGADANKSAKNKEQGKDELSPDAKKEQANELSKEEKMAAEQWLRRIPDDPGGLLRRKFQRQYQRRRTRPLSEKKPW